MVINRSGAGHLRHQFKFDEPTSGDDGFGGSEVGWAERFTTWAGLTPRNGGEEVIAGRLQGLQPYILKVRCTDKTKSVTSAWRVRHARSGKVYAVKSMVNIDDLNAYIEFLVVQNQAG